MLATATAHLAPGLDVLRISLHIAAASVWVGGQVVMAGLVPTLKAGGSDLPAKAARAFARISWPAYALVIVTGLWNYMDVNRSGATYGWQFVFGLKLILVIAAGALAYLHSRAQSASRRGMTAGLGFLSSVVALVLGVALAG